MKRSTTAYTFLILAVIWAMCFYNTYHYGGASHWFLFATDIDRFISNYYGELRMVLVAPIVVLFVVSAWRTQWRDTVLAIGLAAAFLISFQVLLFIALD